MRVFVASTLILGSIGFGHAAELDLPGKRSTNHDEPCRVETTLARPAAPIQISRRGAIYIVQHVRRACQLLADDGSSSNSIRSALYHRIIRPINRAHPGISSAALQPFPPRVFQATPRDIGRTAAVRLDDEIKRLQESISRFGNDEINGAADEAAARKEQQRFVDATAELSFAVKIAYDAYPDLFLKRFADIPAQARTTEHDADFRKGTPPLGSVKLSDAAFALIESFMKEVRRVSGEDQIAAISWAREQKSKGPGDTAWSDKGPGWTLGAYQTSQVPPDVVDTVRGIKIVFMAEDPSALAGKTIDATKRTLFVRD